jgi:hypothetical protein
MHWIVMGLFFWMTGIATAAAQDIEKQRAVLKEIRETAADICYTVQQEGQQSDRELSGQVQAKLNGVISKVVDLNADASGKLEDKQYRGVLQEQLAATLKQSADCKKDVFDKLVRLMLPEQQPSSEARLPPNATLPDEYLRAGNVADFIGNNQWRWTIFISGTPDEILHINCVVYHLHPTFPMPDRRVCDHGPDIARAFPLTSVGWGTFTVNIDLEEKDGSVRKISHPLQFSDERILPNSQQSTPDVRQNMPNLQQTVPNILPPAPSK